MDGLPKLWNADSSHCEATAGQAAGVDDPLGLIRLRVRNDCLRGLGWKPSAEARQAATDSGAKGGEGCWATYLRMKPKVSEWYADGLRKQCEQEDQARELP